MFNFLPWIRSNDRAIATIKDSKSTSFCNFFFKTHTPRTQDAALSIEDQIAANFQSFGLKNFRTSHLTLIFSDFHIVILETALTSLVADRTIERMIDQMKFKRPFMSLLNRRI